MLYSATADELSGAERRYVLGLVEVFMSGGGTIKSGYYEDPVNINDLINFIEHAPAQRIATEVTPSTFSTGTMQSPILAKIMLYDAVRAAAADGIYDTREQDHVHQVGKQLGVPHDVIDRIEVLATKEALIAMHKRCLLLGRPVPDDLAERLANVEREYQQQVHDKHQGGEM